MSRITRRGWRPAGTLICIRWDNASVSYISLDALSPRQRDYIDQITQEDMKLYSAVVDALARTGKASVFARELDVA